MYLHIYGSYSVINAVRYGTAFPQFSEIANRQDFFADFLNVVIYMLLDVHWRYKNMLFCVGNVRHEHLANQIASCFKLKKFKTIWGIKLIILCIVRQPLKLQKYYAILGYDPNILLPNQFAGRFTFDLFHLLILIPRVHCYIVLFWRCVWWIQMVVPLPKNIHQDLLYTHNLQWIDTWY